MEWLVEVIVELLAEFLLALVLEFGGRVLLAPFRGEPSPWVSSLGYLLLGAILGGLSLWLMPHSFLHQPALRVLRMDRFAYGYLMALSLGLVRYFFAN